MTTSNLKNSARQLVNVAEGCPSMLKAVNLGGGVTRAVSYKKLKDMLRELPRETRRPILKKYFPEEVTAEDQQQIANLNNIRQQQIANLNNIRWNRYGTAASANDSKPYYVGHQALLSRALRASSESKAAPHSVRHHTVSDFAGWLYSLYRKPQSPIELAKGKQGELNVQLRKKQIPRLPNGSGWRPIYIDPLDGKP